MKTEERTAEYHRVYNELTEYVTLILPALIEYAESDDKLNTWKRASAIDALVVISARLRKILTQ